MKKDNLKLTVLCLMIMIGTTINAQRTDTSTNAATDFTKQANTVLGEAGGSIKVIDNKGTIKYLQSSNGVTMFTDTAPDGGIITTWQLGGTLTDDTYIDASGAIFAITGISGIDSAAGGAENSAATTFDTSGYSLLVRDEATGETKKLLMTNFIDVLWDETELTADVTADFTVDAVGILATTNVNRVSVYRNGAKLRSGTDYTITTADVVNIAVAGLGGAAYTGDVFEVHFIK
ncbi:hypothetical protein [Polaribacter atrinae]|nr:hypothetical protein [Polaribacter atrinae]